MSTGPQAASKLNIGFRVRARRLQQGLSLRQLSDRTGLSISFLSQLERDQTRPSISSLKDVATALGLSVAELLSDPATNHRLVLRRADRPAWSLARVRFELLATGDDRLMEPQLITYEPGGASGGHPVTHQGEEFGIVLSGRAECWVGEELFVLDEGDCVYFSAQVPHRLRNAGSGPCRYLLVVTPRSF